VLSLPGRGFGAACHAVSVYGKVLAERAKCFPCAEEALAELAKRFPRTEEALVVLATWFPCAEERLVAVAERFPLAEEPLATAPTPLFERRKPSAKLAAVVVAAVRCLVAATRVASTIDPPLACQPPPLPQLEAGRALSSRSLSADQSIPAATITKTARKNGSRVYRYRPIHDVHSTTRTPTIVG
jgi:hypothetical protein